VAGRLNLRGWVRNRMDDSVEVTAQGEEDALLRLKEFLRQGPPGARVTAVDFFWEPIVDQLGPFEIR
jgi:acylphosphatase